PTPPTDHSYDEFFIACARTMPKENVNDLGFILGLAADQSKTKSHARIVGVSNALLELGLRKLLNDQLVSYCGALGSDDDPIVRWHCAYALARTEDSSLLSKNLDIIRGFLNDVGSPEARMFAATALGRIHNDEAGKMLITAARSETEWRVRVNIFNAIAKLPRFSSAIHEVLKKAVLESSKDSATSNHVARAALDVLDQMIAAGKVSAPDSISIREWLVEYLPDHQLHEDQSIRVRSQCMIPLARLGVDDNTLKEICSYVSYQDRTAEINVWKAVGLVPDTLAFYRLIARIFTSSENNVAYVLDGLHSLWDIAKKDTIFRNQIEDLHYASMFRHMLIRFPSLTDNPSIVSTTMEYIKDPTIVTDSLRGEAAEYLLQYLDKYAYPKYHDHLISILSTIAWLKPTNDTFRLKIDNILSKAAEWGDKILFDSAGAALTAVYPQPNAHIGYVIRLVREPIDWKKIESLPDTMLIETQYGVMYLKLDTYNTPLTALNMYKLAKLNWFANNYIHRIVPNFVIQSGDNMGTGDGGPGYAIRTEIAPSRYDSTGVVGMASSGKDTEGSQWFITHCPTPHLNTRYTIWGTIVKGEELIEKYQLNDQIENIVPYK
ncbi:MAG: peptidylprolyl isomerase, partial [Bacteroidota bacterium]|nr:peptidylprolyl isomerase [Bacteroidota bacterium]